MKTALKPILTDYATRILKYYNNQVLTKSTLQSQTSESKPQKPQNITIIDFSQPSSQARLYTLDAETLQVIYQTYVTHGSGSGGLYTTSFSNVPESHKSSLGVSRTSYTYQGKNGLSLKLEGLEPGYNDNIFSRSIVVHGADYIGNGKTGRSWGCYAVPMAEIKQFINMIKNGNLIFAYYPDQKYLKESKFLKE